MIKAATLCFNIRSTEYFGCVLKWLGVIDFLLASGRWLGVRLDLLSALLTGAVALAAVLVSQDAGR